MTALPSFLPADFRVWEGQFPVADSLAALESINEQALRSDADGRLAAVGLVIVPAAFDDGAPVGIRETELSALAPQLRALEGISVRGCLVRPALAGADAETIAAAFHEVYQTAKRLSVLLPCAVPFLGFGGMLAPIGACLRSDPGGEALLRPAAETVAMQNRTAFYAKLFID